MAKKVASLLPAMITIRGSISSGRRDGCPFTLDESDESLLDEDEDEDRRREHASATRETAIVASTKKMPP